MDRYKEWGMWASAEETERLMEIWRLDLKEIKQGWKERECVGKEVELAERRDNKRKGRLGGGG